MKDKSCGNCKHFKDEDAKGWGRCKSAGVVKRSCFCDNHKPLNNGWTEITPDNVDMIDDESIVIVTDGMYYNKASEWHIGVGTMAKYGGYYYYVLPELKIE